MFELLGKTDVIEKFLAQWNDNRDFVMAHTSGSTGMPKETQLKKSDMLSSALSTNRFFNITSDSFLYCPLSIGYIAGKMMLIRALAAGCTIEFEEPSNRPALKTERKIDLLCVVPSQLEYLIGNPGAFDKINNLIVGGSALQPKLEEALKIRKVNSYVTFGMTETCSHVALRKIGEKYYKALPGISFETDRDQRLIIHSDTATFSGITTNDCVRLLSPKEFVWLGRKDNVINTGGLKVFPESVEKKIETIINAPFFISSESHDKWGEQIVLHIETNLKEPTELLIEKFRSVLDKHEIPKKIVCHKKFILTDTGKVNRKLTVQQLVNDE